MMQIGRMRVRMGERFMLVQVAVFSGDRVFVHMRMMPVFVTVPMLMHNRLMRVWVLVPLECRIIRAEQHQHQRRNKSPCYELAVYDKRQSYANEGGKTHNRRWFGLPLTPVVPEYSRIC